MTPIAAQREAVEREWRKNATSHQYPAARLDALEDAVATLRFVERHAAGLRALAHYLIAAGVRPGADLPEPTSDERAALLAHPAVRALLEAWPDAETIIRPVAMMPADATETPEETEA